MSNIYTDTNAPMNTLKPQPGQWGAYDPKFHPLPGDWAREQMNNGNAYGKSTASSTKHGSAEYGNHTEIQRALAAERAQHEYWEEWQGVKPGKAVYENPRELQNTLLPSAKYGTEGRGYG
jgi:hypothetical protein